MVFLSTPSARRATPPGRPVRPAGIDFYPRPPRGGRRRKIGNILSAGTFLSTPSARRATTRRLIKCQSQRYFYPRPPRGGRRTAGKPAFQCGEISIHALREEGDESWSAASEAIFKFLSTPSARRATRSSPIRGALLKDFYPRPPRGGRPSSALRSLRTTRFLSTPSARRATTSCPPDWYAAYISIHALREEGDGRKSPQNFV